MFSSVLPIWCFFRSGVQNLSQRVHLLHGDRGNSPLCLKTMYLCRKFFSKVILFVFFFWARAVTEERRVKQNDGIFGRCNPFIFILLLEPHECFDVSGNCTNVCSAFTFFRLQNDSVSVYTIFLLSDRQN